MEDNPPSRETHNNFIEYMTMSKNRFTSVWVRNGSRFEFQFGIEQQMIGIFKCMFKENHMTSQIITSKYIILRPPPNILA